MSRRMIFVLMLPALALIAWLVAAQLPRWIAPQPGWFAAGTPGVCVAVSSLAIYGASRGDSSDGIGRDAARQTAAQVVGDHYGIAPLIVGEALAVEAILPGEESRAYFVVTARLSDDALPKIAVIYLDAATGAPRTLITGIEDPALNCDFDVRAALLAALRSPPPILLAAYGLVTTGALVARHLLRGKRL